MAQLSTIVSSILRDMVYAQHQANMYAVSLEDIYRKNGRLEDFAMPAIALGEMEISLRYGIADSSAQVEQYEINYPVLREMAKTFSRAGATLLMDTVLPALRQALPMNMPAEDNYLDVIERNSAVKRDLSAYLGHKILKRLQADATSIAKEDGSVNQDVMKRFLMAVAQDDLLDHEDIADMISKYGSQAILANVLSAVEPLVVQALPAIVKDANLMRKRLMPSVDVIVNTADLSQLPEEAIHTLTFKISPQSLKLYSADE